MPFAHRTLVRCVRASSGRETWIHLPIFSVAALFRITIFCDEAPEFVERAPILCARRLDIRLRYLRSKRRVFCFDAYANRDPLRRKTL